MYNINIVTGYNKEAVIEFLDKSTDCCGRFVMPAVGTYGVAGEIKVSEWYNTIPNTGCRQRQYLVSVYRDEYDLLPLYKAEDESYVKVNLGGDPERWGRTYKLTVKELNRALNENICIAAWAADNIESKLEKVLFNHLQLV